MESPIFYDPSGRRRRWSKRVLLALILLLTVAAVGFGSTILHVPAPDPLKLGIEREQPRSLKSEVAHLRRAVGRQVSALASWLPRAKPGAKPVGRQAVVGFYAPWDEASQATLARHIDQMDWVVPAVASVLGPNHAFTYSPDRKFRATLATAPHRPLVLPLIQNAKDDTWDGEGSARMLRDPAARARLLDQIAPMLAAERASGMVFDLEQLPADAQPFYRLLIAEAQRRFPHMLVTLCVPVDDESWDLGAYARVADKLFLMDYDEHYPGGAVGPVASQPWFVHYLRTALAKVPADKLIVAIGNYAYDWPDGKTDADSMTDEDAFLIAHDNNVATRFDPASGNATFDYHDDDGTLRHVWLLDAASAWNQMRAVKAANAFGAALWRLGGEDAGVWDDFAAIRHGTTPPAFGPLRSIGNVDVQGNGEILRVDQVPNDGLRFAAGDGHGLIRDERYVRYPTPYVVKKYGYQPRQVALTFDDGPDARWTPQILDILEAKHAPATFFVIGENALAHPLILKRILDDGDELGNHSYTHPNMALVGPRNTSLELNATQRLVEAYTGRAMRLARIPYFGDAEPTTEDELVPVLRELISRPDTPLDLTARQRVLDQLDRAEERFDAILPPG